MGQKLGQFLRVLGAGLSPQAFQAQQQEFAAEQATERARDVQIETIDLKQGLVTAGVLGKAYDVAREENDTAKMNEITQNLKSLSTRVSGGDQRIESALKNSWAAGVMEASKKKDKPEKTGITMIDPSGKEFMGFQEGRQFKMRDPSGNLVPVPHGSIKAPTKQLTGELSKSQKGKLVLSGIEGERNVRNNVREIGNLMETVTSPDFVGGLTGDAIQGLNSARQQVSQLFGGENYLTESGEINPNAFSEKSTFRAKAIQGELAESQELELAFILAKSLNPDGKISDADVRQAGLILGDSADPKVRHALLSKVQKRIVDKYNSDEMVVARRMCKGDKACMREKFVPLKLNDLKGSIVQDKKSEGETAADRAMRNIGFIK